ncbi:pyruvate kinase, putative [Ichthyophthirius multifiliis]|uniref:pyruvate kinase n=1 Tax=Ichthyophthirius multifiliis TaxID=5932 RepID=G0QY02_ICHMU|nr:pyruvate kinase, putative [Ichthyophthirius multifiliis]EGR29902.1 pyruvate kinase, putative [Ichthyophthirius multifiliis]|eukprot:XP_004031138.1 pyruvate kinase, putative [Ichthyophthirius multifiliis]
MSNKPNKKLSNSIKSRGELLEYENEYYDNLSKKIMRSRRTKIIATVNQNNYKSYEQLREIYKAGLNSFLVNMAYCSTKFVSNVSQWRQRLEDEFKTKVPIICVLKGNLIRIGQLKQPEIYLKQGQEYRFIIKKKIIGDSNICTISDQNIMKKIGIGAKIIIDYGQVALTVLKQEKSDKTLQILQQKYGYGEEFPKEQQSKNKSQNLIVQQMYLNSCSSTSESEIYTQKQVNLSQEDVETENKFAEKFKQLRKNSKEKTYEVIVCQVDGDCIIKSYKPIFIYKNRDETEQLFYEEKRKRTQNNNKMFKSIDYQNLQVDKQSEEYDDFFEQIIQPKDIYDINNALNNELDCICVSNVQTAEDIINVKNIIGSKSIKVIAKIQNLEAIQNFDEIMHVCDGILIARGYLTIHIPVEKLHFIQKQMIQKCNSKLKPVLVSCNILDSMVSSLLPSTCEVSEISNLVSDHIDGFILSGETSYGMYPIQTIQTLSRTCMETEARQISKNNFQMNNLFSGIPPTLINCIVKCTLQAAYNIQASLIMVFTSSGSTALKISKLRPPCPIIAVTINNKVARYINLVSSIRSFTFNSLEGTLNLIDQILDDFKEQETIKIGDFIIITSGEVENLSGTTNNLKIFLYYFQNNILYLPGFQNYPNTSYIQKIYFSVIQGLPKSQDENPEGSRNPKDVNIDYEDINIQASDGIKLHGWICKKQNSLQHPTVVYFHENAGNIGTRIYYLQKYYELADINIILIAYRGYSKSQGTPNEEGIKKDSKAILEHVFSRKDLDTKRIFIHGRSLGGAVSIYAASQLNYNIKGIILENTFTSIADMVDCIFPFLKYIKQLKYRLIKNKWESIKLIDQIKNPILFISSMKDQIVPPFQMSILYEKCKTKAKYIYKIEEGDHNDNWTIDPYSYFQEIQQFMKKCNN